MKRALAAALILAGCASTPAAPPSTQPAASPAVACPGDAPAREGWFRLPDPLKTHPDAVSIAPLPFDPPAAAVRTLANGMQVYLLEDHTVPLVTVHALVRVGAVDDPVGKEGLAELTISGMRVAGAGKRSAEQVDDELEFMAASLEGGASEELAQFSLNVPTASLDAALAIFADVLLAPRFEDKPLQRIFERAREGIRRREDSPGGLASRALQRAVYGPAHPLAREPSLKSLASIRRQDLQATHAATIVPAATRLMVSGDFQPDEMLQRLEQRFGGWKGGPGVVRKLPPPQGASKRNVIVVARQVPQAKVRIGHLGFVRHDPREYALRLADAVLGGGQGPSRLYTEIRDRRGLAYSVGSMIAPGSVGGQFLVAADTRSDAAREVIRETLRLVEGLGRSEPVAPEEVAHARDVYVNNFAFRFDTADKVVFERALHDFHGYPPDYFQTFRERISGVTAEDVNAAAKSLIDAAKLQIVVVGDPAELGDLSEFGPVTVVEDVSTLALPQ